MRIMIDEGLRHQVIWRHATELCSTFVKPVFQTLLPDIESPRIIIGGLKNAKKIDRTGPYNRINS